MKFYCVRRYDPRAMADDDDDNEDHDAEAIPGTP